MKKRDKERGKKRRRVDKAKRKPRPPKLKLSSQDPEPKFCTPMPIDPRNFGEDLKKKVVETTAYLGAALPEFREIISDLDPLWNLSHLACNDSLASFASLFEVGKDIPAAHHFCLAYFSYNQILNPYVNNVKY